MASVFHVSLPYTAVVISTTHATEHQLNQKFHEFPFPRRPEPSPVAIDGHQTFGMTSGDNLSRHCPKEFC